MDDLQGELHRIADASPEAEGPLSRSADVLGEDAMARLAALRVAVFGVGGVGSVCAEALVRTGVRNITIVDDDVVAPSNLNRQIQSSRDTIGMPKVEALRARLASIAPDAGIVAIRARYSGASPDARVPALATFDVVVDAIDSVADKAALLREAVGAGVRVYSSMGAALRRDPTRVRVSRFEKVAGDGLARALRQRFKKDGGPPIAGFLCVHSDEPPLDLPRRGSVMPVTATFGLTLASLVIGR